MGSGAWAETDWAHGVVAGGVEREEHANQRRSVLTPLDAPFGVCVRVFSSPSVDGSEHAVDGVPPLPPDFLDRGLTVFVF